MTESSEMNSPFGSRMRPNNKQVKVLFEDLEVFLQCSRAPDIMLGEWFFDRSLAVPSAQLLGFFAWDLLYGVGKYERFLEAGVDWQRTVRKYVIDLRTIHIDSLWNSVVYAMARQKIAEMCGKRHHVLYWWPVTAVRNLDKVIEIEGGKRRLTRFVLELMTLRATFMGDFPYLEGLAEALREDGDSAPCKPQKAQEIAFQMLRWHRHLAEKLGRIPSKAELEQFIQEVHPDISDATATWSDASKFVELAFTSLRGKKIDKDLIIKLALEARKTGPVVKRVPSWRSVPENDFQK